MMEADDNGLSRSIGCYRISKSRRYAENKLAHCYTNSYGMAFEGEHQLTKQPVFIRLLNKAELQRDGKVKKVAREIALLKKLQHRTIIQLLQLIETQDDVYLVLQYVDGMSIAQFIAAKKRQNIQQLRLKQQTVCNIIYQLILCLQYLRKNRVIHGDINSHSIAIDKSENIKVLTFDKSRQISSKSTIKLPSSQKSLMSYDSRTANYECDIQNLGCLMYELLYGQHYDGRLMRDMGKEGISTAVKTILEYLLCYKNSSTMDNLKFHPWFLNVSKKYRILQETSAKLVQTSILQELQLYGIDKKYAMKCIMKNECNYVTTLYWLLKKKQEAVNDTRTSKSPANVEPRRKRLANGFSRSGSKKKKKTNSKKKHHSNEPKHKIPQKKYTIYERLQDKEDVKAYYSYRK